MTTLQLNDLLNAAGLDLVSVRLMRHQQALEGGLTPYYLWRDYRQDFYAYQSTQDENKRSKLQQADYWVSFVVPPDGSTLFVGIYTASFIGTLGYDIDFKSDRSKKIAGSCDEYTTRLTQHLENYIGRLKIDWGSGARAWIQYPDRQSKQIITLSEKDYSESFPGYLRFRKRLSDVASLPDDWKLLLRQARGVYILTCPRTGEQYVGSASGDGGFYERWMTHLGAGGAAVGLQAREPSDYQVSILEVTGSALSREDIIAAEVMWMSKLQTRDMGLN